MKILSIIVPIYNVEKYLERCIRSLLVQDIESSDYEIVMVNDGSTDNSFALAQKLCNLATNVKLVTRENGGLAAARNTGIENASGKYLMFVDSDDYLMPNILKNLLSIAEEKNLDVCEARMKVMKENGTYQEGLIQPFSPSEVVDGEYALLHGVNIASVCGMLYSSEFISNNHLRFTEGMTHEDVDFNTRVYPIAQRICFTDIISYVYFWNGESLNRSINIKKVKKALMDDIIIAANTRKYAESFNYPDSIKNLYKKRSNSIVVSSLIALLTNFHLPNDVKVECLNLAKSLSLYPIKGKTQSLKTTLLSVLLNQERVLRLCYRRKDASLF